MITRTSSVTGTELVFTCRYCTFRIPTLPNPLGRTKAAAAINLHLADFHAEDLIKRKRTWLNPQPIEEQRQRILVRNQPGIKP
jgi:hypothetical protein